MVQRFWRVRLGVAAKSKDKYLVFNQCSNERPPCIAVGWGEIDLSQNMDKIADDYGHQYPHCSFRNDRDQIERWIAMENGDPVIAMTGTTICAIGKILRERYHKEDENFIIEIKGNNDPGSVSFFNRIDVEWLVPPGRYEIEALGLTESLENVIKQRKTIIEINGKDYDLILSKFNETSKSLQEVDIAALTYSENALSESEISKFPDIGNREGQPPKFKEVYYSVDEIKQEQAKDQHKRLIAIFSKLLSDRHIKPKRKGRIDLFGVKDSKLLLFEMKSITSDNERKQIRSAIGQLWDYEFLELENYRNTHKIFKAIVLEKKSEDSRIVDWLRYSGIFVYWLNENNEVGGDRESLEFLNQLSMS